MTYNKSELTAYCGLYCGDCIRFNCKASDLADSLLDEIKEKCFIQYAEVKKNSCKEFEQFEILPTLLKAISKIKCELPCSVGGDGCGGSCTIIACVKRKSINGCWDCNHFEKCEKLYFLIPFHGESIKTNLRLIKKHGIPGWVEHRDKCYPWLEDMKSSDNI